MRQFYAPTEDIIKSARSWFSTDHAAGVATINVKNSAQFEAGKYICLGREGDETSELKKIESTTATTLVIDSVTVFPHYIDQLCTQFDYNQRKLYSRATTADTWAEVATDSPKDIAVDSPLGTLFEDSAGLSTTQYICTYYNEFAVTETAQADAKVVLGTSSSTNLCTIGQIRNSAGWQDNPYVSNSRIDEVRQQVQGEVWAKLHNRYVFPLTRNSSFLQKIVVDMTVGYLFLDEYGQGVQNAALDGQKRLDDARSRLEQLANGGVDLYDEVTLTEQTFNPSDTIKYYPDDSTLEENEPENNDERIFGIGMKF
jgi:hypothetical protein